jgi:hypothetical protein
VPLGRIRCAIDSGRGLLLIGLLRLFLVRFGLGALLLGARAPVLLARMEAAWVVLGGAKDRTSRGSGGAVCLSSHLLEECLFGGGGRADSCVGVWL